MQKGRVSKKRGTLWTSSLAQASPTTQNYPAWNNSSAKAEKPQPIPLDSKWCLPLEPCPLPSRIKEISPSKPRAACYHPWNLKTSKKKLLTALCWYTWHRDEIDWVFKRCKLPELTQEGNVSLKSPMQLSLGFQNPTPPRRTPKSTMLMSLHKMAQYLHAPYTHPPGYFKSSLDSSEYLRQCKWRLCYTVLFRE